MHSLWPCQDDDVGIMIVDPERCAAGEFGTLFGSMVTRPNLAALSLRVTDPGVGFMTFGTMISDHTSVEET
jgi:hypothetical protein